MLENNRFFVLENNRFSVLENNRFSVLENNRCPSGSWILVDVFFIYFIFASVC